MSQNRHKQTSNPAQTGNITKTIGFYLLLMLLACILVFGNASASQPVGAQSGVAQGQILKSSLSGLSKQKTAELDWRTQSYELNFDLPAHDWYDKLDLFLSAYPLGKVAPGTPLLISYNGAQPVPLYGRSARFDAHIRMDTSRIRLTGNTIKITYKTPAGSACLTPDKGKWVLDLSRSKLVASVRPKKRAMQISEIEHRLAHPMTAPKRIGIIALGDNKLAYEALSAQALSQRMDFVPEFKLGAGVTDMVVLVGTYTDLKPWLNNKSLHATKGTKILIDTGKKPRLVLGGETEEQVLELVRAFAGYHLPGVQRSSVSLQDLLTSKKLSPHAIVDSGDYKLSDIGTPALARSWQPDPAIVKFNVADPYRSSGVLTLNIFNAKDINPKSRLSVDLNSQAIGYTYLNKSSKKVEFKIKQGMFFPTNNRLSFTPELLADDKLAVCDTQKNIPTILISNHSRFHIKTPSPAPPTGLSRFAATGEPFDKNALIVLSGKSITDRQASLQLLGFAASRFGPKWALADYAAKLPPGGLSDKNILFIGPDPMSDPALFNAAPGGLKRDLRQKRNMQHTRKAISVSDQFASSDMQQIIKIMATQNASRLPTARLQPGGLAALFTSPYAPGRVVGIISSDQTHKFSSAVDKIAKEDYWNALRGSMVRWDDTSIVMTQTTITPTNSDNTAVKTRKKPAAPDGFIANTKNWFASLSLGKRGKPSVSTSAPTAQTPVTNNQTPSAQAGNAPLVRGTSGENNPNTDIQTNTPSGDLPASSSAGDAQKTTGWQASLSNLFEPITPAATKFKAASTQAKQDVLSWWKKTSNTTFENTPFQKWGLDFIQNPTLFFLLLAFLIFFFTALCSPMTSRNPKR